jgi:hypothetical protein
MNATQPARLEMTQPLPLPGRRQPTAPEPPTLPLAARRGAAPAAATQQRCGDQPSPALLGSRRRRFDQPRCDDATGALGRICRIFERRRDVRGRPWTSGRRNDGDLEGERWHGAEHARRVRGAHRLRRTVMAEEIAALGAGGRTTAATGHVVAVTFGAPGDLALTRRRCARAVTTAVRCRGTAAAVLERRAALLGAQTTAPVVAGRVFARAALGRCGRRVCGERADDDRDPANFHADLLNRKRSPLRRSRSSADCPRMAAT